MTQQYISNVAVSLFQGGGAGVITFFMISGYIILHVIQLEKPIEFLIKRFFRIYPLLIVAIILENSLGYFTNNQLFDISKILIQMSLFGDYFNTPYALAGVEWTLRVEIIFYLFMVIIGWLKMQNNGYFLLAIFVVLTLSLKYIAPFPDKLFVGYFTIYFPFLFLGSVIYLYEKQKINLVSTLLFVVFLFENYFSMINDFQKGWLTTNFAIVGFIVFISFWLLREKLENFKFNRLLMKVSALTYSIYLFHNYLWVYIGKYFYTDNKLIILAILIVFCFMINKFIENPMNQVGKFLAKKANYKLITRKI
ncbi:acyltransferase [Sulfurospirillum diekertiae]|uniref:acyltransferase family protein n=1 Tax=Sulfurospirillum diekertiae TaxID=1854492 RepID=UPI0014278414|nr:acyltransferase [Sulfurospirillum diekertiae]